MLKDFIKDQKYLLDGLLGTIIADGYIGAKRIVKGHKNPAYVNKAPFEVTHTSKNLDYLLLLKELVEMLPNTKATIVPHNKKVKDSDVDRGYRKKEYFLYRLATNSNKYFANIRGLIYYYDKGTRIKKFPQEILNRFNDLSILLLYLDDGTLKVKYNNNSNKIKEIRVSFCLNSFTESEIKAFMQFLKEKYDIEGHYYKHTISKSIGDNRGYVAWLNTKNTNKFMDVIDKFYNAVPSMNYKFVKYYSL